MLELIQPYFSTERAFSQNLINEIYLNLQTYHFGNRQKILCQIQIKAIDCFKILTRLRVSKLMRADC